MLSHASIGLKAHLCLRRSVAVRARQSSLNNRTESPSVLTVYKDSATERSQLCCLEIYSCAAPHSLTAAKPSLDKHRLHTSTKLPIQYHQHSETGSRLTPSTGEYNNGQPVVDQSSVLWLILRCLAVRPRYCGPARAKTEGFNCSLLNLIVR